MAEGLRGKQGDPTGAAASRYSYADSKGPSKARGEALKTLRDNTQSSPPV